MKTTTNIILFLSLALLAVSASAQTTVPLDVPDQAPQWLLELVAKAPWLATVAMILGVLRLVFKPLCSIVHDVIEKYGSPALHEKWESVSSSTWFKWIGYILDYSASIKIVKPQAK